MFLLSSGKIGYTVITNAAEQPQLNEIVAAIANAEQNTIDKDRLGKIKNRPDIEHEKSNDDHNALQPEAPPVVAPDSAPDRGPNQSSTVVPLANHLELCAMSDIERLKILIELAEQLDLLHKDNVVHGRVELGNLFIEERNDGRHVVLRSCGDARACAAGWCAPEIIRGEEASWQSDIFGLGVVLLTVWTGMCLRARAGEFLEEQGEPATPGNIDSVADLLAAEGASELWLLHKGDLFEFCPLAQAVSSTIKWLSALDPARRPCAASVSRVLSLKLTTFSDSPNFNPGCGYLSGPRIDDLVAMEE